LYKVETLFYNTPIYLLDFDTCVAFTVLFENEYVVIGEYGGRNGRVSRDWKIAKPRGLKKLKINNLQVIWRKSKTAWMTAATMEEWLNMFHAKMKKNRNVILFLDNATCHPKVTVSNVKIAWFPANASSAFQPIDMGVIYIFKSHYRLFLM
jgi:hypothetical protein